MTGARGSPLRILAALLLLLPLAASPAGAQGGGFGVAPSQLDFGDVVRGEPLLRVLDVQNGGDAPARVTILREGPLAESLRLDRDSFIVPPGSRIGLNVTLAADHMPNGRHAGGLVVRLAPEETVKEGGSGAKVALAVRVDVSALVGGPQRLDFRAGELQVGDGEAGGTIPVSLVLENRGNVRAAPVLQLRLSVPGGETVRDTTHNLANVLPGDSRNDTLRIPAPTRPGQYRLDATVRDGGIAIHLGPRLVDVLEPGALRRKIDVGPLTTADLARNANHRLPAESPFLVQVPVRNVGEANAEARFEGVLLRDGALVRTLKSDAYPLEPGQTATLRLQQDPLPPGTYLIRGEVRYDGRVTEERETVLTIEATSTPAKDRSTPGPGMVMVVLSVAGLALLSRCSRR